jgi:hypothetical protein
MSKKDVYRHFGDGSALIIGAFRYFVGRMTIAGGCFADDLAHAWDDLPGEIQRVIKRDLEDYFIRDDEDRRKGAKWPALGLNCDRAAWEKVRAKYVDHK